MTDDSERSSPGGLRHRDLSAARRAYSEGADESERKRLSQAAHSVNSTSAHAKSGDAHNDEINNEKTTLVVRGGVEGAILALSLLTFAAAAGWPAVVSRGVCSALLGCWAVFSGARESLELLTYRRHYNREKAREAWGRAAIRPCAHAAALPFSVPCPVACSQSWSTFLRARRRRWSSSTRRRGCPSRTRCGSCARWRCFRTSSSTS